jgi:ADP-dependent NAD(P)H-hydrate dehydratase / NAD(P)H-hydrate epimerase
MSKFLPPLTARSHKYSRGVVGVIAGSLRFPGAALLAVGGARLGGAGYIKYSSPQYELRRNVIQMYPDVVPLRRNRSSVDAWVIGPGAPYLFRIPYAPFILLDGSMMARASRLKNRNVTLVLTPHEGEARALGFEVSDRIDCARKMAEEFNAYILLKGHNTVIASPKGAVEIDRWGTPHLATAGSGDVLAGLLGSMLASWQPDSDQSIMEVLALGVEAHGKAARAASKRGLPVTALDILQELPLVLKSN